MLGKNTTRKVSAAVLVVISAFIVAACGSSQPAEKPWQQKFNDEVSGMDINLGTPQEPPAFEFSLNQPSPHFSMILCMGPSDDSRLQEDSWSTFFNEARKYGPAQSYKPDFTESGEIDGKPFTRVMMFVNLKQGADETIAQEVARKMVAVMKEASPCK